MNSARTLAASKQGGINEASPEKLVRDVRVLERFSLLSVPSDDAERVVETVSGTEVAGQTVQLQRAG